VWLFDPVGYIYVNKHRPTRFACGLRRPSHLFSPHDRAFHAFPWTNHSRTNLYLYSAHVKLHQSLKYRYHYRRNYLALASWRLQNFRLSTNPSQTLPELSRSARSPRCIIAVHIGLQTVGEDRHSPTLGLLHRRQESIRSHQQRPLAGYSKDALFSE
jgi:hypothetical protein